ncbi:unnamed protein product, partial [Closterium sp. NIES-54]
MAVAPDASLHCTAESNLARSLSSSRSRRARENPSLQSHVEYEELPETGEREMLGFKASGSGRGAGMAGNRAAEKSQINVAGEGGDERGRVIAFIEQAEGGEVGNLVVKSGRKVFPFQRCSLLSGSGNRRGGGNLKKRRILPSEDEVRAAAADWPTLGATLRRALGVGRGGDAVEGARFSSGGEGAGAEKAGEKAGAERAGARQTREQGQGGLESATGVMQEDKATTLQQAQRTEEEHLMMPHHHHHKQQQQQQQPSKSQSGPTVVPGKGESQNAGKSGAGTDVKASHECRFCGKEFGSFRALGGHMNLHRR